MLHAPATHVIFLMGVPVVACVLGYMYSFFFKTHLIESTSFRRLGSASVLSFENPPGFKLNGAAYVYVMLPWLNKTEWHAFSVFPDPICMQKVGKPTPSICAAVTGAPDSWTRELHATLQRPTRRAAWVCGPFLSPYPTAIQYGNIVAVASGIGITPALSLLNLYKASRRVNLIWVCRDNALIEHFLARETFDGDAFTLIYYTGKVALSLAATKDLPPNVNAFKGRPNLESVVTGIIHSIESGKALPENIVAEGEFLAASTPEERARHAIFKMMKVHSDAEIYKAVMHKARASARKAARSSQRDLPSQLSLSLFISHSKEDWNLLADSPETERLVRIPSRLWQVKPTLAGLEPALLELAGDAPVTIAPPSIAHVYGTVWEWQSEKEFSKAMHALRSMLVGDGQANPKASALEVMDRFEKKKTPQPELFQSVQGGLPPRLASLETQGKEYVAEAGNDARDRWEMLYCGGSAPVVKALKDIESKYGISLAVEKFDW